MNSEKQSRQWAHGADMVVGQLEAQGVKQVFDPGAKIDKVFDSAGFVHRKSSRYATRRMRRSWRRQQGVWTGKAGGGAVTSGPGCSNLITGIATANSEGRPGGGAGRSGEAGG